MAKSSLFNLFIGLSIFLSERYMVQLSANKMKRKIEDALDMSLIYRMKSSGSRIEL